MCHKQSCPIQPAAEGSFPFVPTTSFMIVQTAKKGFWGAKLHNSDVKHNHN